jgi:hypothetical protein
MLIIFKIKPYMYAVIMMFFIGACTKGGDDEFPPSPEELIRPGLDGPFFPDTELIRIPPYSYLINNQVYEIEGDSISLSSFDTLPSSPSFSWQRTNSALVKIAIFEDRIEVDNDRNILNPESIIWTWDTGMNSGVEGAVTFFDGKNVLNGNNIMDENPTPLLQGEFYTYCIWSWSDDGISIEKSSREFIFYVD